MAMAPEIIAIRSIARKNGIRRGES